MNRSLALLTACFVIVLFAEMSSSADSISDQAKKLHFSSIVLDTHDDTTQRFFTKDFDIGKRNATGSIDIPRMKEGGMNAIFFSIWIDGRTLGPPAIQKALDQIDAVKQNVKQNSKNMVLARTGDDVRRAHDTDVDLACNARSQPLEFAGLQHAEQLGLSGRRQVADLV